MQCSWPFWPEACLLIIKERKIKIHSKFFHWQLLHDIEEQLPRECPRCVLGCILTDKTHSERAREREREISVNLCDTLVSPPEFLMYIVLGNASPVICTCQSIDSELLHICVDKMRWHLILFDLLKNSFLLLRVDLL